MIVFAWALGLLLHIVCGDYTHPKEATWRRGFERDHRMMARPEESRLYVDLKSEVELHQDSRVEGWTLAAG